MRPVPPAGTPGRMALAAALFSVVAISSVRADQSMRAYRALDVEVGDVLNGTVLQAQVRPNAGRELVALVTAFTGKKDNREAVDIRLAVLRERGEALEIVYSKRYFRAVGDPVARGELQLIDFDGDGIQEIVVRYDVERHPLIREREGEILVAKDDGFEVAWKGTLLYDATRAARDVEPDRRDHYLREIDVPETLRTRGVTLFLRKTVVAVAGERLPEPKRLRETAPLLEGPRGP